MHNSDLFNQHDVDTVVGNDDPTPNVGHYEPPSLDARVNENSTTIEVTNNTQTQFDLSVTGCAGVPDHHQQSGHPIKKEDCKEQLSVQPANASPQECPSAVACAAGVNTAKHANVQSTVYASGHTTQISGAHEGKKWKEMRTSEGLGRDQMSSVLGLGEKPKRRVRRTRKKRKTGTGGSGDEYKEEEDEEDDYSEDEEGRSKRKTRERRGTSDGEDETGKQVGEIFLSDRLFMVNSEILKGVLRIVRKNSEYGLCIQKLWASMCPEGIDIYFTFNEEQLSPSRWFMDSVINTIWREEAFRLFASFSLVGYACVTYAPRVELGMEVCPHVVDPEDYVLVWRVDQYGVRHYMAAPKSSRIPVSRPVKDDSTVGGWSSAFTDDALFENADVFIESEPLTNGDVQSRANKCLDYAVFLAGMRHNYQLLDHARTNIPLILQSRGAWQTTTPPWAGGSKTGGRATVAQMLNPTITSTPQQQRSADIALSRYAQTMKVHADTVTKYTEDAISAASAKARVTSMLSVDPETGRVDTFSPELMWQRSVINLPGGVELANMTVPDTPSEFGALYERMQATICAMLGVPADLVTGPGGRANVASSMTTHEHLRATVQQWRSIIEETMVKMYWRIYGEKHVVNLAAAAAEVNVPITVDDAMKGLRNMGVTFAFRSDDIEYDEAKTLFEHGYLRSRAFMRVLMKKRGLSRDDLQEQAWFDEYQRNARLSLFRSFRGESRVETNPESRKAKSGGTKEDGGDDLGDIGIDDVGSIAFTDHIHKPRPVKKLTL